MLSDSAFTVWFTGLPASGKTTLARLLERRLLALPSRVEVLDGDLVRTNLSKGLGFSKEDRDENVRRIGFVCQLLSRNGIIAVVAVVSPYRRAREEVRSSLRNFVEIHMDCPLQVLINRDPKGLYKKAIVGDIDHFTGISDPYEPPQAPELTIHSDRERVEESLDRIWTTLQNLKLIRSS
jgi:adenylyl-sulfate kinase